MGLDGYKAKNSEIHSWCNININENCINFFLMLFNK